MSALKFGAKIRAGLQIEKKEAIYLGKS